MTIKGKIGTVSILFAGLLMSQAFIGSANASEGNASWPVEWQAGGASTTVLPKGATVIPSSGGANSYLFCASTGRCYLNFRLQERLTDRNFTVDKDDLLEALSAQGFPTTGFVETATSAPAEAFNGKIGADGNLVFTLFPTADWKTHPGGNGAPQYFDCASSCQMDLYVQVVDSIPIPDVPVTVPPATAPAPSIVDPPAAAIPAAPVESAVAAAPVAALAFTGKEIDPGIVIIGGTMLLLGLGLIVFERRRKVKSA
jgi:hypothetical protein